MGTAFGGLNTLHWIRNSVLDFQETASVKIMVEMERWRRRRRWEGLREKSGWQ